MKFAWSWYKQYVLTNSYPQFSTPPPPQQTHLHTANSHLPTANQRNGKHNPDLLLTGIPIPLVFDVQKRIQHLRSYLDPGDPWYQPEQQHVNIRATIKLYEDGKIDGVQRVYIVNGEVVTREEAYNRITRQEAHNRMTWTWIELCMLVRLIPQLGGDGAVHGITAMNDAGSNILALFDTDMACLGSSQGYAAWVGPVLIGNANGAVDEYPSILVEVQLARDDNSPWSGRRVLAYHGSWVLRSEGPST